MQLIGDALMRGIGSGFGMAETIRESARARKKQEESDAFDEGLKRVSAEALQGMQAESLSGLDPREAAMRRAEAVAEAQADWAIKHGKVDDFKRHFAASADMREYRRGKAFAVADRAFNMSRDFNAYVPALNAIDDGKKVLGFLDRGNGMLDVAFEEGGKKRTTRMSADDALKMINGDRDPAAARAQELQYRWEKYKHQLKRADDEHASALRRAEKRDEQTKAAALREPKYEKAGPGDVVLRDGVPVFQNVGASAAGAAGGEAGGLDPGKMLPVYKNDADHVMTLGDRFGVKDPINGERRTEEGEALVRSMAILRQNPSLAGASPAVLAEIVLAGKVGTATLADGSKVRAIEHNGQRYILPTISGAPAAAQKPRPGTAGAGAPAASDARLPAIPGGVGVSDATAPPAIAAEQRAAALAANAILAGGAPPIPGPDQAVPDSRAPRLARQARGAEPIVPVAAAPVAAAPTDWQEIRSRRASLEMARNHLAELIRRAGGNAAVVAPLAKQLAMIGQQLAALPGEGELRPTAASAIAGR